MPSPKFKYCRKRLLARAYGPRRPSYVFALITKRDFATIPSQINNLRGQSTVATEQIRPHKYITKRREKSTTYF